MKRLLILALLLVFAVPMASHALPPDGKRADTTSPKTIWFLAADYEDDQEGDEDSEKAVQRELEYNLYEEATDAIDDEDYERAVELYDRVIEMEGRREAGAMYWKAYALYKQARRTAALEALNELQREHRRSRWAREAEALEVEIRQESGATVEPGEEADDELRLMIVSSLMHTNPEKAVPVLKKLLAGDASDKVKEQALFVLTQYDSPEVSDILADFARDERNPKLQYKAIEFLGVFGAGKYNTLLRDIYSSTTDRKVKQRILESFMIAGDTDQLLKAARNESDSKLRRVAVEQLGVLGKGAALAELYETETSVEIKGQILEGLMIANEEDLLLKVARSESSEMLRERAIQHLSVLGHGEALRDMYRTESSAKVRRKLLEGFMIAGDSETLMEVARTEDNSMLRGAAVELLGVLGRGGELWTLYNNEPSVKVRAHILQGLMIAGESQRLLEVIHSEDDPELRRRAIEYASTQGGTNLTQEFTKLYDRETDRGIKSAIIQGLFIQGDVDGLIDIVRKETDRELRKRAVEHLSIMDSRKATEFLLELLDDE